MKNSKKERCVLTSVIETELDILKRHVHVLKTLEKNQPMGIIKLSELTGYTAARDFSNTFPGRGSQPASLSGKASQCTYRLSYWI